MKQVGNTILAKGGNHILAKRDNSAWPKGSKLSGFSTHPFKKAYSYGQKELAIPILSLNPTIKLNEEKPHKQRIMQKFDKPVKEYHKISEEFPVFQIDGKRGTLLH